MTRVLVCYGSKSGGTAGIAEWIGSDLSAAGIVADVREAGTVHDVSRYEAVIIGGSLYAGRWHRHARRFARRYARELSRVPVWLFSSGPLENLAETEAEPPVAPAVHQAAERLGAVEHRVFGGVLTAESRGWLARKMAETHGGDFRDRDQVRAWAADIARTLRSPEREPSVH